MNRCEITKFSYSLLFIVPFGNALLAAFKLELIADIGLNLDSFFKSQNLSRESYNVPSFVAESDEAQLTIFLSSLALVVCTLVHIAIVSSRVRALFRRGSKANERSGGAKQPIIESGGDALSGVSFDNVSITGSYGRLLDRVSGQFYRNELTALIGPNASGKSTLLRVLVGYLNAERGGKASVAMRGTHETGSIVRHRSMEPENVVKSDGGDDEVAVSEAVAARGLRPYDLMKHADQRRVRRLTGYCPTDDTIWDELTAWQQVSQFNSIAPPPPYSNVLPASTDVNNAHDGTYDIIS